MTPHEVNNLKSCVFTLQWVNTSLVFKAAVAEETNTFCSAFPTQCYLQSELFVVAMH